MKMIFSADLNWGIGCGNELLFRVPGDMARFKEITTGNVVIMGRATLESLPKAKPLPNRTNIILTSNTEYYVEGALVCNSQPALFAILRGYDPDSLFVIGGATVYRALMPYCDTALITRFLAVGEADCFMPDFDALAEWRLAERSEEFCENGLTYRFDKYKQENPLKY